MRCLMALFGCVVLASASVQPSLSGVWVLDRRHSRFTTPAASQKIVMQVEATTLGLCRVMQISTDAAGQQHLQVGHRLIDSVAGRSRTQVVMRQEEDGAFEVWTLGRGGRLRIEPTTAATRMHRDRLVFKPAHRRTLAAP